MIERLLVCGVILVGVSGVPGLFVRRTSPLGERIAVALLAMGGMLGITAAGWILASGAPAVIDWPWAVPGGRVAVHADAISAMFLIQIFGIAAMGAVYGLSYWRQADHPDDGRKLRLFYGLVTSGLAIVVCARNVVLFLFGWELMAIAAFFLVTTEDRDEHVRESGLVYLVATRLGTLCLYAFFALLHVATGSFDFAIPEGVTLAPGVSTALFLLALVGFGLKAGIMPLHVWLPGAHANAPSHVSALMSGVLIKMGIYGLVRTTALFPHPPAWWGGLILGIGAVSGILGVAFAIGQHDIKRLLAYHSVENIGIIVMGLGLAELGRTLGLSDLVTLGIAGSLLHVWNHGIFKALLFLGAGAVAHATGTREIDRLGGLAKKMPLTALGFLVGSVAICGLPPLNGFVSEYLLYVGMLGTTANAAGHAWLGVAFGAPALALIGGLAVACFVKVYGAVFLGEPRTAAAHHAHDPGPAMLLPMAALSMACVFIGTVPMAVATVLDRAAAAWIAPLSASPPALGTEASRAVANAASDAGVRKVASLAPLGWITGTSLLLLALIGACALVLRALAPRRNVVATVTWDCGYRGPTSRMQTTSSSFAEMLVGFFKWALRPEVHVSHARGLFPSPGSFHSEVKDTVLEGAVHPAVTRVADLFGWFRWVQQGSIHAYLLYMLIALIVSLSIWR